MRVITTDLVRSWWISLVISLLIIAGTSYAVSSHTLTGGELAVFRAINDWPDNLRYIFWGLTQLGSAWTLYAITLLAIWKRRHRLALRLFLSGALASIACELLKQLIGRPRPETILGNISLRDSVVIGNGFPSGHTAAATALVLVLWPIIPSKWRWLLVVWVLLVGLSRVYLGVHAPLDIVGGVAVGVLIVSTSQLVTGKLRFVTKITRYEIKIRTQQASCKIISTSIS